MKHFSLPRFAVLIFAIIFLPFLASSQSIRNTTGPAAGGVSVGGSGTVNTLAKWTAATTLGNSTATDDGTLFQLFGTSIRFRGAAVAGPGGSASFFNILNTLPTTHPSGRVYGADLQIASAGSETQEQHGMRISLTAGKTNTLNSLGLEVRNSQVGGISTGVLGSGEALGGDGIGIRGSGGATGMDQAYGVVGQALTATSTVGGYFYIGSGEVPASGLNAALVADNQTNLAPIVIFRDNGSTVWTIADGGSIQGAISKTLTESSATAFSQIAVPSGSFVGGAVEYTIHADDGTNFQARTGRINFSVVNKAGTETCTLGTVLNEAFAESSGASTLTNTFTCNTSPTNGVNLESNAISSLTQTTLAIKYSVHIFSGTATVTPQ